MCRGLVCAPGIGVTVIVALSVFKKGIWKSKIFVWASPVVRRGGCRLSLFALKLICRLRSAAYVRLLYPRV